MKYSEIKAIKKYCTSLHSQPNYKEVLENIIDNVDDFEVDNVRFISKEEIDSVQQQELKNDLYILGCFNSDFLSDILGIDGEVLDAMQDAEAIEAIGKLIVSLNKLEDLQAEYSRADGYGHHFNSYDHSEDEFESSNISCNISYYVFDNQ